ncbi:helix-turn-helix transcriptional regulator [Nocardioides humilatus]|uniref:Helix-turn-helix transcriptional regulator n=1 Tax=Nocardioides humilatus TaxID=2607660 RepID=A0A5B1LPK8_9ACTN|nr:helix-turn-helix transcriptional regulator [Nocardioides humilatus]KAA1421710.1 helix-turn-helix transcriptional regulator [Nocardioides humilatus]
MESSLAGASAARLARLRAAVEADDDPNNRVAHAATLGLIGRAGRADAGDCSEMWGIFPAAAVHQIGQPGWAVRVGVMANLIGLAGLGEAEDFIAVSRLAKRYGYRLVATVQNAIDPLLGSAELMPLASSAVAAMSLTDRIALLVREAGLDADEAGEVAHRAYQVGFWLVMAGVDPDRPGPVLTTPDQVAMAWDHGGMPAWRGQLAIIAANPWAPYCAEVRDLAAAAGRTAAVHALEECAKVYRTRFERRERELVAREIRELVAISGLSQREFASMLGTSASRLSTYVNGLVTPSATLMVRIRRVSEFVRDRGSVT